MKDFNVVLTQITVCENTLEFSLIHNMSVANSSIIILEKYPYEFSYAKSSLPAIYIDKFYWLSHSLVFAVPRFDGVRDRICNQFEVELRTDTHSVKAGGICYVTDIGELNANTEPFPDVGTIKGLQVHDTEDAKILGIKHAGININQPSIARPIATEETILYSLDGRDFYFDKKEVEHYDKQIKELSDIGANVYLILLNSPEWGNTKIHPDLKEILYHPDFTESDEDARISAFNTVTSDGFAYYKAFISFICQRYMSKDSYHGRAQSLIISNEVNSQYVWGNAGEKTVDEFAALYIVAMRTAWCIMRTYYQEGRVYLSLEHHWTLAYKPDQKRYYGGKTLLDALITLSIEEGNFGWGMAHHPYPENLFYCDFWNDKTATDNLETGRITFKNLQVLVQYLNLPINKYKGKCRNIILSEQGFHSEYSDEWEALQKAAYCLAYEKVLQLPDIDCFIYHAHYDNRFEFGLNLGVRRRNEAGEPTNPKPIYYAMRDIDTPKREELFEESRKFLEKKLEGHKNINYENSILEL